MKTHKRLTREVEHTGNTTAINIMTHEEDKPNTGRDTVKIKQKKNGKRHLNQGRNRHGDIEAEMGDENSDMTGHNTRGHTRLTEATWKYEGNVAREQGDETRA